MPYSAHDLPDTCFSDGTPNQSDAPGFTPPVHVLERGKHPKEIIADSPGMQEVFQQIEKFASSSDASILITGETGTGKEVVAALIHKKKLRRADGPFVAVNCGAIPGPLLESELFGHEKGAFTGAYALKKGKAELAHGGSLFLDEVGELPLALQVKLLRFLETRQIDRVGGTSARNIDVQIISATNKNLFESVKKKEFREDLYYRLAVLCIHLPPLRERGDDVHLLAYQFLEKFARELGRPVKGFTPETLRAMESYPWPGNIRELLNKLRRAVVMAENEWLSPSDLSLDPEKDTPDLLNLPEAKEKVEHEYLQKALSLSKGNISRAARLLKISRPHLYTLMRKYSIKKG